MTATLPESVDVLAPAPPRRTHVPEQLAASPDQSRRKLRGVSRAMVLDPLGAAVSAVTTSLLLFGRIAPIQGALGFVVTTYVLFLVAYAFMTSVNEDRPAVVDRVMAVLLATAAGIALLALSSVILFVFLRGRTALFHTNFFTQDMRFAGPREPLTVGGIKHAITGTLIIIGLALFVTVPLGLTCAVFLTETRSRFVRPVRMIVDAMTALPSIIAGLFIFAVIVLTLGFERSGLAAALAISLMMLPIIVRSSDVVLRLVPGNLREASAALGAPTWRTAWHVVLPTARSGLTTSVLLGMARGIGETAPVLLTSGFAAVMNLNPVKSPMASLSLTTYEFAKSGQDNLIARGYGTAAVLLVLVLSLFSLARILGGRPAGIVTKRQARRLARRSARDFERFQAKEMAAR